MASQAAGKNIGYVLVDGTEGTFRGAVLVTDFRGIPADFRYTDPITPSKIEKILYGNALDVYIKEELILESLVGAVEVPPVLWICRDGDLLDPLAKLAKSKTILLAPTARAPLDATGDMEKQNDPGPISFRPTGSAPRSALPCPGKRAGRRMPGRLPPFSWRQPLPWTFWSPFPEWGRP